MSSCELFVHELVGVNTNRQELQEHLETTTTLQIHSQTGLEKRPSVATKVACGTTWRGHDERLGILGSGKLSYTQQGRDETQGKTLGQERNTLGLPAGIRLRSSSFSKHEALMFRLI